MYSRPYIRTLPRNVARNYKGVFNPFPQLVSDRRWRTEHIVKELVQKNASTVICLRVLSGIGFLPGYGMATSNSVDRNPWDKTLSNYHMRNCRSGGQLILERYFAKGWSCKNYKRYTDNKGRLLVDRVVKYEDLAGGLSEIFSDLGIPFDGSLGTRAKSEYRSDRRSYQEVLCMARESYMASSTAGSDRLSQCCRK
jgi:hypothetical protein